MLVLVGIMLGGLGDIGLLDSLQSKKAMWGVLAFFAGHICYVLYILDNFSLHIPIHCLILIPLIYLSLSGFVYARICPHMPAFFRIPGLLYMLILSSLSCLCLYACISHPCCGTAIAFAGASFFLVSDGILAWSTFVGEGQTPVFRFFVMLTYILAQALLAFGWAIA